MTNVKFPRKQFEKEIGQKITKELEEKISLFGTPLESMDEEELEVEIFPNRPDLISIQGYSRAFKQFLGKSPGLVKYNLQKPKQDYVVKISPTVKEVRPFTTCAIVTGLKLDDEKIKQIVDLQEKLHSTLGRNRKKSAIGVYPLEKISLPIKYEARTPDKIKFIPLEETREMTANQILNRHPKGRDYAHLLDHQEKFPVFVDSKNKILSMPPIINSDETGKVTEKTKDVFIECSGSHLPTLQKTLNIIVTTLADMGGKIHQMKLEYGKENMITPNLNPEKMRISTESVNSLLGMKLKDAEIGKLLEKMGHEYKSGSVCVPAWRTDILHEVDLVEEVAIAYGYENLKPEIPNVSTTGGESPKTILKEKIREALLGVGLIEFSSYHLIKKNEADLAKLKEKIEIENSKTEYKFLRPNLLIPSLRIFSENKDHDYPQETFEIGTTFSLDEKEESGIKETEKLCVVVSPGNFTKIKQILNHLAECFKFSYTLKENEHPALIPGRAGEIVVDKKPIGHIGEVHPQTLKDWAIKMPLAVLEIEIDFLTEQKN